MRRLVLVLCALLNAAPGLGAGTRLAVAGADVTVTVAHDGFPFGGAGVVDWVRRSADIVGRYYGRFPVRTLAVEVTSSAGATVRQGKAFPADPPVIRVTLGREVSGATLTDDWVLPHEMIHLALPELADEHAWLAEGLATYVEGVARVQAGNMTETALWDEYVHAMPKGLPGAGDRGLDRTHTWGRTYWGGALFCLVADVTIRERTGNRAGLQDALRAIARDSGGMTARWPIGRVLAAGDAATGTRVLRELYDAWREQPAAPDLAALWQRLGVEVAGDSIRLSSEAPAAGIRAAITRPPAR